MRSGFASVATENGASIQAIKGQGGWKSDRVAKRYIRRREGWETTAASKLGCNFQENKRDRERFRPLLSALSAPLLPMTQKRLFHWRDYQRISS
jgi:hypothetical protein